MQFDSGIRKSLTTDPKLRRDQAESMPARGVVTAEHWRVYLGKVNSNHPGSMGANHSGRSLPDPATVMRRDAGDGALTGRLKLVGDRKKPGDRAWPKSSSPPPVAVRRKLKRGLLKLP